MLEKKLMLRKQLNKSDDFFPVFVNLVKLIALFLTICSL